MSGDRGWAAALRSAAERPAEVAAAWRADGGLVVGTLGWSAPRELVTAAGMLAIRLSPDHLAGPDSAGAPDATAAELGRELTPGTARFAAALLGGALGWIDFLLIGRDREDYTKLFYVLRELRRSGAAGAAPPVAFFDLLRLPSRTSARYNRRRAAELTQVMARWAGRPVTSADLASAAETSRGNAQALRGLHQRRTRPQPAISGVDALAAAMAARTLPAGQARPLLDAALAVGADPAVGGPRVFLAGSAVADLTAYAALEERGIAIVGEDHEWGDDGSEYPRATRDPLDGIVDRYHLAHGGAARAGLRDRVGRTADRAGAAGADGVLYLLGPHDEAARWELPALRDRLGPGLPLVPVRLPDSRQADAGEHPELADGAGRLLAVLGIGGRPQEAAHG